MNYLLVGGPLHGKETFMTLMPNGNPPVCVQLNGRHTYRRECVQVGKDKHIYIYAWEWSD